MGHVGRFVGYPESDGHSPSSASLVHMPSLVESISVLHDRVIPSPRAISMHGNI